MSVYDLYQSYLNQAKGDVTQSPVMDPNYLLYLQQLQQQQGGGDGPYQEPQLNTVHAGIYSIQDLMKNLQKIPTPFNLARMGIQGIGNLISNIRDPYKTFTGALKPDVQAAITRDEVRDLQGRIDRGDFGGKVGGGEGKQTSGGFSSQGGPYGSGAGGLHSY